MQEAQVPKVEYAVNTIRNKQIVQNIKNRLLKNLHTDDVFEKNRKLRVLLHDLQNDFAQEAISLLETISATENKDRLIFGKIKVQNENAFAFIQNTLLRIFVAPNYETIIFLHTSLNDFLLELIQHTKDEEKQKIIQQIKLLAESIICLRYRQTSPDYQLQATFYQETAKTLLSMSLNIFTTGATPLIPGLLAARSAKEISLVSLHYSHKIYTVTEQARALHSTARSEGLSIKKYLIKAKDKLVTVIKQNKLMVSLTAIAAIGLVAASFIIPSLGIALSLLSIAYGMYSLTKKVFLPRHKQIQSSIQIVNQQLTESERANKVSTPAFRPGFKGSHLESLSNDSSTHDLHGLVKKTNIKPATQAFTKIKSNGFFSKVERYNSVSNIELLELSTATRSGNFEI